MVTFPYLGSLVFVSVAGEYTAARVNWAAEPPSSAPRAVYVQDLGEAEKRA